MSSRIVLENVLEYASPLGLYSETVDQENVETLFRRGDPLEV